MKKRKSVIKSEARLEIENTDYWKVEQTVYNGIKEIDAPARLVLGSIKSTARRSDSSRPR
jgi:hypothetical protein